MVTTQGFSKLLVQKKERETHTSFTIFFFLLLLFGQLGLGKD